MPKDPQRDKSYWAQREQEIKDEAAKSRPDNSEPQQADVDKQLYDEGAKVFGDAAMYQAHQDENRREQLAEAREQKKKGFLGRLF